MTSPNEPGYPRAADGPGSANGAIPDDSETGSIGNPMGRGHVTDPGDTPPWQRGPAARAQKAPPRSVREPSRPEAHHGGGPAGQAPDVDARLNRFISGGSAASASAPETADQPPAANRHAVNRRAVNRHAVNRRAVNRHAVNRRSARPTRVNFLTCPARSREPRNAMPWLNAASRRRRRELRSPAACR